MFSVVSKVMIVLLGFGYTVCQSRFLGASIKGDISYIDSVTKVAFIVLGFGIHQAYPYFKKKTGENVAPFFLRLICILTLIYLIIAIGLSIIFHSDIKLLAIFMLTPCLVYNRVVSYINMVETPNKKNATELIVNVFELLAVVIIWLFFPPSVGWGVFLLLFKDLLLGVIYTIRLRKQFTIPVKFTISGAAEILRYGLFPMLCLLMTTLNYRVDIIMLKQHVSSAEVGVYSVGVMLAERVWMIPDALKEVMISNLTKGKDYQEVGFVIRICNTVCIFVVLAIVLLGQPFINLFFGEEYSEAYIVTVIILIGVVFMIYYKMIGSYNIVHGKQKENFIYLLISVITNVIANMILIPRFGNNGAAIASILSYGMAAALYTQHFCRNTGMKLTQMLIVNKRDVERIKSILIRKKQR
ncbi:MAG: polysaccharide biosynthesis C-terminal domain-containing protein [Oscillospiraceae bacterium]|jgi:O-antigen/teichoic acid export membrane protein|nr:polysaccharide biosynthesis C-terminal domain-containing protein [Oscillospiraceae bacterium]